MIHCFPIFFLKKCEGKTKFARRNNNCSFVFIIKQIYDEL